MRDCRLVHRKWVSAVLVTLVIVQLCFHFLPDAHPQSPPGQRRPVPAVAGRRQGEHDAVYSLHQECRTVMEALVPVPGEQFFRVATARVLVADYDLLRRDFPSLVPLDDAAIDAWLLDEVAYLSSNHWAHVRLPLRDHVHLRLTLLSTFCIAPVYGVDRRRSTKIHRNRENIGSRRVQESSHPTALKCTRPCS